MKPARSQQWWLARADELLMSMIDARSHLSNENPHDKSRILQEHCAVWLMVNFGSDEDSETDS